MRKFVARYRSVLLFPECSILFSQLLVQFFTTPWFIKIPAKHESPLSFFVHILLALAVSPVTSPLSHLSMLTSGTDIIQQR